ncbi:MAG: 50S ribosomal protein L30 [Candidatus Thermoplasmatota archaeon]|nr:50S ribosomal protein L30 [Candidatus Thermoplasmatota archaeon]MBU1940158.1 50S ribosomal protein L30 [Candidatus Thermoplasmatota archaeon]
MVYAVVRVRGTVNIKPNIKKTLHLLNLTRVNHCTLINENKVYKGMLQVVKDYTTWGEINTDTLTKMIKSRGMLVGDKEITDEYIKGATPYKSIDKFADAIQNQKISYKELPDVKPIFRLHPPKKGFEGIKRSFVNGGALGYRGEKINDLLTRML